MNKELIKEIIKMYLQNEKEVYKAISELTTRKETKEKSDNVLYGIECMLKHIDSYDSTLELICENLNKKEKKTSKTK